MEYPFKDLMPLDEAMARDGYYEDWTHIDADTFHQISELVKFIREKGYGSDTREAIAQALERVYYDAMKSGNADMELSMARNNFKDLASRLDASDKKLDSNTAQLAQDIQNIVSGSPKGTYATLADLQAAYPNGTSGVYIVKSDGHWYYWQSSTTSWQDGGQYQAELESDYPATNLISNADFSGGRGTWQQFGGVATTVGDKLQITSDGSSKLIRLTQPNTGEIPKSGDKIFGKVIVRFETTGFLEAQLHMRDWVTGGTFDKKIDLSVSGTSEQTISMYTEITEDFNDRMRFYLEGNLITPAAGQVMSIRKPILLNLTKIFGAGNEPSHEQVEKLLEKFGGWFNGTVAEFMTKEETKAISSVANRRASDALRMAEAWADGKNLVFENFIQNGNFANADFIGGNSWRRNGITNTNASNYVTRFNATAKDQTLFQSISAKKNHVYYVWAQVKSTSDLVSLMVSNNLNASRAHSGNGAFEFLSTKYMRENDSGVNIEIRNKRASGLGQIEVKYVGAIDLTEVFGAGNEPEVYEMDEYIKRLPNMWFDGVRTDILTLKEYEDYYRDVERKKNKVIEFKASAPPRYVERTVPKTIMTITYDDECSSIYDLAFPIHQSENVPGVFYVIPSRIGTRQRYNYGVADEWHRIREMNEASTGRLAIEHHTYSHREMSNRSREPLSWEMERSNEIFWRNEIYPKHLAYPGGAHDFNAINVLQDYVQTGTTTSPVVNGYDLNPMRIHRYGMDNKSLADIKAFIDNAVLTGGWIVTYQHSLSPTGLSPIGLDIQTPANQLEVIQYAKSKGVEFVSLDKGLEMYAPQIYIQNPNDIEQPSFAIQRNGAFVTNQ